MRLDVFSTVSSGCWVRLMDAIVHNGKVQMIDSSIVRVH
jgi:hypothetical protein